MNRSDLQKIVMGCGYVGVAEVKDNTAKLIIHLPAGRVACDLVISPPTLKQGFVTPPQREVAAQGDTMETLIKNIIGVANNK